MKYTTLSPLARAKGAAGAWFDGMARRFFRAFVIRRRAWRGGALAVIVTLLALVFTGETLVTAGLDAWLPPPHGRWFVMLLNAGALTLLCMPFVVFVVRSFRRRSRLALRALDIASDGYWVVDPQGRLSEVNAGYARMSGYSRAELRGMHINELDALQTRAVTETQLAQIRAAGSVRYNSCHRRRDGSVYDVHVTAAWLARFQCYAVFVHDETKRAAAERATAQQAVHFQRLLDSTAEGIYGLDAQGRCTFINRAALQMLGYAGHGDEAALIGCNMHETLHRHADGRPCLEDERRLYRGFRQAPLADDEVYWRRDGSRFSVACRSTPIVEDGEVRGAIVTFTDLSEQLRARATLQLTEQRAFDLIDSAMDAIISIDAQQRIVLFNRAAERVFGIAADEVLGSPMARFVPVSARSRQRDLIASLAIEAPAGRHPGRQQSLTGLRADGSEFPMEASWSRLQTEQGPLMTVMLRDVTELHSAREAHSAHRARTDFLSRMSHELRTPLNAVLGFAQLLRLDTGKRLSATQRSHVARIHHAGEHLLALVNDVLDLSRIEAGQMPVTLEPVNLALVADEALGMLAWLATAHEVTLRAPPGVTVLHTPDLWTAPDVPTTVPGALEARAIWVQADRVRLRQVLLNLLSNAIKYNARGGQAVLSWQLDGQRCRVQITDTGPGLSADQLARLYEPFNRLGAERTSVEGTGIGLVVARRLTELMNGGLAIDSTAGHGTVATLTLHCAPSIPVPAPPWRPSRNAPLEGRLKVLYAEDDEVNVELVRAIVALRPGITLQVARSGAQAIAQARRDPPELLLLDMNLGDMTGLEVAHALREHPATRGIPLVALSADALPQQIDTALSQGVAAYLTKPIDIGAVLTLLDEL
ncbi:MAG: PAS domain S-box protein, partial [Burkholderiales bacterium]|nr:PAS domain S-box protein [Burkholderiales bacterium]